MHKAAQRATYPPHPSLVSFRAHSNARRDTSLNRPVRIGVIRTDDAMMETRPARAIRALVDSNVKYMSQVLVRSYARLSTNTQSAHHHEPSHDCQPPPSIVVSEVRFPARAIRYRSTRRKTSAALDRTRRGHGSWMGWHTSTFRDAPRRFDSGTPLAADRIHPVPCRRPKSQIAHAVFGKTICESPIQITLELRGVNHTDNNRRSFAFIWNSLRISNDTLRVSCPAPLIRHSTRDLAAGQMARFTKYCRVRCDYRPRQQTRSWLRNPHVPKHLLSPAFCELQQQRLHLLVILFTKTLIFSEQTDGAERNVTTPCEELPNFRLRIPTIRYSQWCHSAGFKAVNFKGFTRRAQAPCLLSVEKNHVDFCPVQVALLRYNQ